MPDWALVDGYVHAADFSNWQPSAQTPGGLEALLAQVSPRPWHIIVRASHENATMRQLAVSQMQTAVASGYGPGMYGWSYGDENARDVVKIWLDIYAAGAGGKPPVLWIDAEGESRIPNANWMLTAFDEAVKQGVRPGLYSGFYWLKDHFGATDAFAGQLLWMASYGVAWFSPQTWGGMRMVGHQYTSSPWDRSVFLPEAVA